MFYCFTKTKESVWDMFSILVSKKQFQETQTLKNRKHKTGPRCFQCFVFQFCQKHGEQADKTIFINGNFVISFVFISQGITNTIFYQLSYDCLFFLLLPSLCRTEVQDQRYLLLLCLLFDLCLLFLSLFSIESLVFVEALFLCLVAIQAKRDWSKVTVFWVLPKLRSQGELN